MSTAHVLVEIRNTQRVFLLPFPGSTGKCIRTVGCWLTPEKFVQEGAGLKSRKWRRDIQCHGKPLAILIEVTWGGGQGSHGVRGHMGWGSERGHMGSERSHGVGSEWGGGHGVTWVGGQRGHMGWGVGEVTWGSESYGVMLVSECLASWLFVVVRQYYSTVTEN